MDCPCCWTVAIIICLSLHDTAVLCQNEVNGEAPGNVVRDNRDCSRSCGNPTSSELYNSILTAAASNGVLPDLLPILQGQPIPDNVQRYSQDILTKPLSVVPMTASSCVNAQEPIIVSGQPLRPTATNPNFVVATPLPCGSGYSPNTTPAVPQTILPSALPVPLANCVPQIVQQVPFENYPVCAQNAGLVLPMPIVLQPQSQFNEINPYNVYSHVFEPEFTTQASNLPISPPSQILPIINTCLGPSEIATSLGPPGLQQPIVFTNDGQPPLSLQINVPTQSIPAPRITVVSATPTNSPVPTPAPYNPDFASNLPQYPYPPPPPIVLGGCSKSSLRNLLPIILLALCNDRGSNKGSGCCCCCSCNGGNSGNSIPIPYPIPIPTNNPIINNCPFPYSSRNRGSRDDGDDDDD